MHVMLHLAQYASVHGTLSVASLVQGFSQGSDMWRVLILFVLLQRAQMCVPGVR